MNSLLEFAIGKKLAVLGTMSGTSADGLDLALCRIERRIRGYDVKVIATAFRKYPFSLRQKILTMASQTTAAKSALFELENNLLDFYVRFIKEFIRDKGIRRLDLIGSHGQTIYHCDRRSGRSLRPIWGTWQIVDGAALAAALGVPVVSDFRVNDLALGGSGAPLTPICHQHLFGDRGKNIAVLNIGGISNLTFLPGLNRSEKISASDCGPGNMLVDELMRRLYNRPFDRGGKTAQRGKPVSRLLALLKSASWFRQDFPKSLGREQFGPAIMGKLLAAAKKMSLDRADVIATVSEFTVACIAKYLREIGRPEQIIVCGGGRHNDYFLARLEQMFPTCRVIGSDRMGIDPDFVEATSFALLAVMFLNQDPGNLPQVTGAIRQTVLGKLALP